MSEFTPKESDVFDALKRHTEPPRDYIHKERITRDDVEKIKRERKIEELKKELMEAEAEINDTKDIIKEYDKKITNLLYGKACMEEKLDLVNEKIDALKDQIECISAKPRVFKCKEQPNPYGATQGTYAIYRNGYFEYKKSLQLKSMACKMTMDFVPSGFEEVTDLFEKLKNGSVIFVVPPKKRKDFFFISRYVFDKPLNTASLDGGCPFIVYKYMNINDSFAAGDISDIAVLTCMTNNGKYTDMFENAEYVMF